MTVPIRTRRARAGDARHGNASKLARAGALSMIVLAASFTGVADAAAPEVTITGYEQLTNDPTPIFSGTTSTPYDPDLVTHVKLKIYNAPMVEGEKPVREVIAEQGELNTGWSATVTPALAQGSYVAQAEQSTVAGEGGKPPSETGKSTPVTFTVDTDAPVVTITSPETGGSSSGESQTISGTAGTAPGDIQSVTVEVFAGPEIPPPSAAPLTEAIVAPSGGRWSAVFALAPGTYTARAVQLDEARNVGISKPDTFTLTGTPHHTTAPPTASFTWVPAAPVAGQGVALVSSSSDPLGIASYAWDIAGNGPFSAGGPVLTTSFATPGNHTVRLLVVDALGAQNIATATIPVGAPALTLMQPFPIVRIAGSETSTGVRVSSLSVQAPVGVRVSVTCRGRGCKMKSQSAQARATAHNRRGSSVLVSFPRFERFLRAGVTLEIRVFSEGEIGKYTRFVIRHHGLPKRADACLAGLDPKPIACPG
jgi:PKD domain